MKFSIITPEHSPENIPFLLELYESICSQTFKDYEWILFLNNRCKPEHIPESIKNDPKVRLCIADKPMSNIGEIKNVAFNLGLGEILVEADHDDILTSNCLEELDKAFDDGRIGFVYSDNAVLHMKNEFVPFDKSYGWSHRVVNFRGKELYAMNSFPASSHSVGYIWYAPDHVRAWRASVYREVGGHNPELSICDDHELMIKTYLATTMFHIPRVLYVYRITGDNTWLARNEAIQIKTKELFNQYARALAEKDSNSRGLLNVDIGGGINPFPGYFTIDMREGSNIVADLNEGIPLPDSSVGVLNASHIIEHLRDKTKIMAEIHRVLAPGGWAFIEVPSTDGRGAFQDPTHVSYWNENSFLYYTDAYLAQFIDNTTIRFQEYRKETYFPNDWMKNLHVSVVSAWLVALKPGMLRLPGLMKI